MSPTDKDVMHASDHLELKPIYTQGDDEALKALDPNEEDISEAEYKAVLRKIDWRLTPVLMVINMIQIVDKNTLGSAATYGLIDQANLQGPEYCEFCLCALLLIKRLVSEVSYCVDLNLPLKGRLLVRAAYFKLLHSDYLNPPLPLPIQVISGLTRTAMLVTLFYLGYMIAEYPSTYLMQKFPTGKYLMANFIIWGAVLACTSAATSFPGLAAGRFFLGFFEAPLNPGLVIISSSWWKTHEQARRVGMWYSLAGFASVPITMVFYGIAHIKNTSLWPYQWMFMIFGVVTVLIGISLYWILPDSPTTARFLNERERYVAVQRVKQNQTGIKNSMHKRYQVWEAFKDYKVWMLAGGVFFQNMTNTLQNSFNGLIIKGLGFSTYEAVLLTLPVGFIFGISCLTITWILGTQWGQGKRCFAIIMCYCPGLISTVLLYRYRVSSSTLGVLLFAILFLNVISTCAALMYSLLASNIAGYTKKSVVNSIFFIAYSLGNIVSPQAFLQSEAPRYQTGIAVTLASFAINILLFSSLYCVYRWENKKRDRAAQDQPELTEDEKTRVAFSDLTDNENKTMRYTT